jgi:Pectate lyase superfamily protein
MRFLFVIILSILYMHVHAAKVISVKKFGAKGDGKTNDTEAFRKAARYVNDMASDVILQIPAGVYIVGDQKAMAGVWLGADNIIELKNCSNIRIEGKNATIKYQPNLYFGAFDKVTLQPIATDKAVFLEGDKLAYAGVLINLITCNHITIVGLKLEGNLANAIIGGKYGDAGIQALYSGISIHDSKSIYVRNSTCNNFGLDGITVSNVTPAPTEDINDDIVLENCSFNYNGRQGLSWVGGIGGRIFKCNFVGTGTGKVGSAPAYGIDLESETGLIKNIVIEQCYFYDNANCAIGICIGNISDISINKCKIIATRSWALLINKPKVYINECKIYGSVGYTQPSLNSADAVVYNNCYFADTTFKTFGKYLVEIDGTGITNFYNCYFKPKEKKAVYFRNYNESGKNLPVFQNCIFDVNAKNYAPNDFMGMFVNIALIKNKFYWNVKESEIKGRHFSLWGIPNEKDNEYLPLK